jgi:hypothetical protein
MSMREDLSAALDSNADGDDTQDYEETLQQVDTDETEEPTEAPASTEESGAEDNTPAESTAEAEPQSAEPTGDSGELAKAEPGAGDSIKAPVGWGPKEREDWSKIPRHLQDKVMAREREMSQVMEQTATARKTHDQFGQLVQRYGPTLQNVAGNTPMEAVSNLFNTVSGLNTGSAVQKAGIIANLISDFNVDISTLDSAIVGAAPSEQQQQDQEFERRLNERMAPFEQQMGQQKAYENQQHHQRQSDANNEVQQFAQSAEFLADVRHDMADLIDMSAKQGRQITMQQAYDKACTLNPQIQAVIQQRTKTTLAGKRAASASITGSRGGAGPSGGGGQSIRDTIAGAWDSQGKI